MLGHLSRPRERSFTGFGLSQLGLSGCWILAEHGRLLHLRPGLATACLV